MENAKINLLKISKKLSYLLRHCTEPLYVDLNNGWADTKTIISVLEEKYPDINMDILKQIVANDEKGRYSFNDDYTKIRANQGHSIPGIHIDMENPVPPEYLYHGTATRFLPMILEEGLKPMSRQYVHFSPDLETAVQVGKRHGKPVVLVIRAADFVKDGYSLYRSSNGVWLAEEVPCKYFTIKDITF